MNPNNDFLTVLCLPGDAAQLEGGGDVDDVPTVLAHRQLEDGLRAVVGAEQIDVDDGLEAVVGDLRNRRGEVSGRVVDEDVETAVVVEDALRHALDLVGLSHVEGIDQHLDAFAAKFDGRFLADFAPPRRDRDARTVAAEDAGDFLPDAGAAAGHEGDLTFQELGCKDVDRLADVHGRGDYSASSVLTQSAIRTSEPRVKTAKRTGITFFVAWTKEWTMRIATYAQARPTLVGSPAPAT